MVLIEVWAFSEGIRRRRTVLTKGGLVRFLVWNGCRGCLGGGGRGGGCIPEGKPHWRHFRNSWSDDVRGQMT